MAFGPFPFNVPDNAIRGDLVYLLGLINGLGPGGGVTQIVPGTNVTISPAGGTGVVTVNASGGSGVTSVTGTAPIVSSGGTTPAISLANTAVTPGSYTSTNLTVDAQGRITAAANGSGGGVTAGFAYYMARRFGGY